MHVILLRNELNAAVLQGYHYDDADGGLYFNGKTGMLDDVYGDYYFATPQEHSSCKLDPKGKMILDGEHINIRCMNYFDAGVGSTEFALPALLVAR